MHPLAGVIAKVRRADAHLILLYNEVRKYLESAPHVMDTKRDAQNGDGLFILRLTREPPLDFSTIIGDVVHNLRCSLDYIAAELIKSNGFPTTRLTQFPICETETDFFNESIAKRRLTGIAVRPFNRIALLQPYQSGPQKFRIHPFWILHKLSNFDKHHALNLSALSTRCEWRYITKFGRLITHDAVHRPMHDGAILGRMPRFFIDQQAKIESQITTLVTFRDAPTNDLEVVAVLQAIRGFISDAALPALEPFFDPLPDSLRLIPNGLTETNLGPSPWPNPTISSP